MIVHRRPMISMMNAVKNLPGMVIINSSVLTPYLLEPYTNSATIFFGTIAVVVAIGACVPVLFGKETVGQLEMVAAAVPELGKA